MKIIAVASGKGGVGKSCVAAYTGAAFAQSGKKVLLLELGRDTRSLDLILGVPETALYHLDDVLDGSCDMETAIAQTNYHENLHLLPCNPLAARAVPGDVFSKLLSLVPKGYDYLIVDGAELSMMPPRFAHTLLMVVTPDSLSIRSASMLVRSLYDKGENNIRLVINNVPPEVLPMFGAKDFDDVIDIVAAQLIAVIPRSPKLQYASNNAEKLSGQSLTPQIFTRLAERLEGKSSPLLIR